MKIDIGCGPNKREGFVGLDQYAFPCVDHVVNLGTDPLPFADDSVTEAYASHFVEHLTAEQRCQLFNELYRVMKPEAQMTMIVPSWSSCRAYGDPTHKWPPIGGFFFFYLNREWRDLNAPHTDKKHWLEGYDCHFIATWGGSINPAFQTRSSDFQQFAMVNYIEGLQDIHATLIRK